MRALSLLLVLFASSVAAGCSCGVGSTPTDAGRDAPVTADAPGDSSTDAPAPLDAPVDAPSDAEVDAFAGDAGPITFSIEIVAPPGGHPFGVPLGASERGEVVGYAGPEAWSPVSRAMRIAPDATTSSILGTPADEMAWAYDVDEAGSVVGGFYRQEPYAWVDGTGHVLDVPDGWFSGAVHAIGTDGRLVGSFADSDDALPPNPIGPRPCTWAQWDGAAAPLAPYEVGLPLGAAWAVSATGAIAGSVETSSGFRAARWDSPTASPTLVGELTGVELGEGRGIDVHGDVVGRVTIAGTSHAFAEIDDTAELLPALVDDNYTEALGMNDAHWIVGTTSMGDGTVHAVLWIGGPAIDLNDRVTLPSTVRHLSSAVAVTNDGLIAAEAVMTASTGDEIRSIAILRALP